jgi:hypothetical protein
VVISPFETHQPLVRIPGQNFSSVEAALMLGFAAWFTAIVWTRTIPQWRTALSGPWLAVVGAAFLAAAVASDYRLNAVHMAGRSAIALTVYLVAVNAGSTRAYIQRVFVAGAAAGLLIAMLSIMEYAGNAPILSFLRAFRAGVAVAGLQVRAAGPFQYPTIASMYLEILFSWIVALVPPAVGNGRGYAALALVALAAIAEAIVVSFTRTGLLAMGLSLAIVGGIRAKRMGWDRTTRLFVAITAIVAFEILAVYPIELVRLRLTTEGPGAWYQASVEAPPALSFATGATIPVPVTLTNTGRATWDSSGEYPTRLTYHWILPGTDRVGAYEELRTSFSSPIGPGARITIPALVRAPGQPGQYRLMWDLVQEGKFWFSTQAGAVATSSAATVTGPVIGPAAPTWTVLPALTTRPGRFTLWRIAARMLIKHPLFGVGPDNFRLLYGRYGAIPNADPQMHSNNMYIEVLAGGGLVAGMALVWFGWQTILLVAGLLRRALVEEDTTAAGLAAAIVVIACHGLVDSFLSFTATYVLFAIALGLAVAHNDRKGALINPV